jgi:hypothetical protein
MCTTSHKPSYKTLDFLIEFSISHGKLAWVFPKHVLSNIRAQHVMISR